MKSKVYNKKGEESGEVELPESIFGLPWNSDLVHQVVVAMQANARTPVAHTKDRSDVRGGGKKPWRQKGTGRARHGSTRSPIWKGGGVTFGPRNEKSYKQKINKKMKTRALYTTLSRKVRDNEILFVDALTMSEPKSKEAKDILNSLSAVEHFEKIKTKRKNAVLIALSQKDENTEKSFKNFGNVAVEEVRNLNPVDVLSYKYVVFSNPKDSLDFLKSKQKEVVVKAVKSAPKNVAPKVAPKKVVAKSSTKKVTKTEK